MAPDLSMILPRVLIVSRRTVRKNKFVDFVGEYHLDLIVSYGAAPVIVPRVNGVHMLLESFQPIHGVLLCEGEDIDPSLYDAELSGLSQEELDEIKNIHSSDTTIDREKDSIELALAKLCLERNIPYLGICRGSQVLNVACGGTLYQDLEKELSKNCLSCSDSPEMLSHLCQPVGVSSDMHPSAVLKSQDPNELSKNGQSLSRSDSPEMLSHLCQPVGGSSEVHPSTVLKSRSGALYQDLEKELTKNCQSLSRADSSEMLSQLCQPVGGSCGMHPSTVLKSRSGTLYQDLEKELTKNCQSLSRADPPKMLSQLCQPVGGSCGMHPSTVLKSRSGTLYQDLEKELTKNCQSLSRSDPPKMLSHLCQPVGVSSNMHPSSVLKSQSGTFYQDLEKELSKNRQSLLRSDSPEMLSHLCQPIGGSSDMHPSTVLKSQSGTLYQDLEKELSKNRQSLSRYDSPEMLSHLCQPIGGSSDMHPSTVLKSHSPKELTKNCQSLSRSDSPEMSPRLCQPIGGSSDMHPSTVLKNQSQSPSEIGQKYEKVVHMNYDNYDGHRHVVKIVENTPLHKWFKDSLLEEDDNKLEIWVNSYHHQGVKKLAQRFVPMAFANDGLIEGFYDPDTYNPDEGKFIMGLQFHPERMRGQDNGDFDYPGCAMAYQEFVKAVIAYEKKLNGCENIPRGVKLNHELESKRKSIIRSFSIAKNMYSNGLGGISEKVSELEPGAEFLEANTALSVQQENRLKQMGATVRNASTYMNRLKMNEERERMARAILAKMSIEQLSDMIGFYHKMGQLCSEALDNKFNDMELA